MKKHFVLSLALFLGVVNGKAQRDTIALNADWQFTIDKKETGFRDSWYNGSLPGPRTVQLPHTWNVEEENQQHYGWGWYQKKIFIPAGWKNKQVSLQFGAINHTAFIYLNGKKIGENAGDGFSKFTISLDGLPLFGKENTLTVACNNAYHNYKVPFGSSFDWPNDGGIIRKVSLVISDQNGARYLHAAPQLNLTNNEGKLQVRAGYAQRPSVPLHYSVVVKEENQSTSNTVLSKVVPVQWKDKEAVMDISLTNIHPWHFDFPNLYRIEVTVFNGMKVIDKLSAVTGFRDFRFAEGQTFLNGERVKLMGVEWTAGSNPDYGFAETDTAILRYCRLMKEVNAIFTRQHFRQDELFYDFCDRNGILVQQEVPLWGPETPSNDTIRAIAMKQLERMVLNYYNHPSIFSWGVGNELRGRDTDLRRFIGDLLQRSRALDPTRYTAYVSNTLTWGFSNNPAFVPDAASVGDYLMMNEYGGSWWDLPVGKIHLYLDSVHMSYPDKPFFISEFGLCEPNFKGGDKRRIEDMIYHMAVYESKSYVEGAIYFDLTDYRTHYPGTSENNKYRRRVHGIYDMYGKPKPSMKVLRDLSSPVEWQGGRQGKKGKLNLLFFGSIGLPQHTVKGYKVYVSDREDNFRQYREYDLPELKPGARVQLEVDDLFNGKGIITVVRPTGYVVTQGSLDWKEEEQ